MCTFRFLAALLAASFWISAFALEPDQVYAKVAPSIVVVVGHSSSSPEDMSYGSGVIIAPGQIITNCHVVDGSDVIYLKRDKHSTIGIIRYADSERDLCQIGATDPSGFEKAVSRIEAGSGLRVGQKVYAIGAPQGLELTLSDGLIASLRVIPSVGTIIQTNAPISKGSSGGGLFDSNARLIGITSFMFRTGQNLNFAVPAYWISELATRQKLKEEAARKEIEAKAEAQAQEEEAERKRQQEEADLEKQRLESERLAAAEREKRAEAERLRIEEEEKRAEQADPGGAKREAEHKQRESEEAKRKANAAARVAQQKFIDDWKARIQAKIKSRVVVPQNMEGNPQAVFEVVLLPGGEVFTATLKKSSGNTAYDMEVQRAISAAQPLPVPTDADLFHEYFHDLILIFRPKDSGAPSTAEADAPMTVGPPRDTSTSGPPIAPSTQILANRSDERALVEQYVRIISAKINQYEEYPPVAKRRHWEGTTVVQLRFTAEGKVADISVAETSGHDVLDEAAVKMIRNASPLPVPPEGLRGRDQVVAVPIIFRLDF